MKKFFKLLGRGLTDKVLIMKLILSLLFIFSFSSCNLKVTELAKVYVQSSLDSDECLVDFSKNMKAYFAAKISSEDFQGFWLCFANSIDMFASVVKGKETDTFTITEIFTYISRLLGRSSVVTEDFKTEVTFFKKWLLGGKDVATKKELKQLSTALRKMTPPLLKLLENMEFYNLFSKEDSKAILNKYSWAEIESRLEKADKVLSEVLSQFNLIFPPQTNYSASQFKRFIMQMDLFFNEGVKSGVSTFAEKQEAILQTIQKLILPQNKPGEFAPSQWKILLSTFSDSYPLFIQYKLFIKKQHLFEANKLEYFVLWIDRTSQFINSLLDKQPQKVISYSQLVSIFTLLNENAVIPLKISEKLLSTVLGKFFTAPESRANTLGLNKKTLQSIQATLDQWARAQIRVVGSANKKVFAHLSLKKSTRDLQYYNKLLSFTTSSVYVFQQSGVPPLLDKNSTEKIKIYNLFIHNNLLSIVEKIFYAYSLEYATALHTNKPLSMINVELKPKEVKNLIQDIFDLLKSFDIATPGKVDSISELVKTLAQFFSYSARGVIVETQLESCYVYCDDDAESGVTSISEIRKVISEDISFAEIFDFFNVFLASLKKTSEDFPKLTQGCGQNCVNEFFKKLEKSKDFSSLNHYFSTASVDSKNEFFSLLSKNIFSDKQQITKFNLFASYAVFYFIEIVMLRYDVDKSGILDKQELKKAFVVFEGLTIKLLELDSSDTDIDSVKQAFHFALTMPPGSSALDKINFALNPPPLQADPLSLMRILSTMLAAGK